MKQARATGSAGNVVAGLASFVVPGLGQLVQGRVAVGLVLFAFSVGLWVVFMGWVVHILAAIDAARYTPELDDESSGERERPTLPPPAFELNPEAITARKRRERAAVIVVAAVLGGAIAAATLVRDDAQPPRQASTVKHVTLSTGIIVQVPGTVVLSASAEGAKEHIPKSSNDAPETSCAAWSGPVELSDWQAAPWQGRHWLRVSKDGCTGWVPDTRVLAP